MLTWRRLLATFLRFCWLSGRIALHRKLMFMLVGTAVFYGGLYLLAVLRPGEGFSVAQALFVLVELPGSVLAIYLTMDLVAGERDRNTLEILFTTSTSHYVIWSVRLVAITAALAAMLLLMSSAAYLLFAEFPFVRGALNALVPALFMMGLTLLLSVSTRSSNTAGMLALAAIIAVLLASGLLESTPYYLFLNPFTVPLESDADTWNQTIVLNRLGLVAASLLLMGLALRKMEHRERFLS
jgi:ABC-type transport system involved in multi-copper enzyme maturation permease subunit